MRVELTRNRVNGVRATLGGLIAGIVLFFSMGVINGLLLNADWNAWKATVGGVSHAPSAPMSLGLWFVMSLVCGQAVIWIYAGLRVRYGAGPETALRAGFLLWLAAYLSNFLNQTALGILPSHIIVVITAGAFIASHLAALAGAAIYKED